MAAQPLQFTVLNSLIEVPFYAALRNQKIDHDKLDDSWKRIMGQYQPQDATSECGNMRVLGNSLSSDSLPRTACRGEGRLKNFNTVEEFNNVDKTEVLKQAGQQIWAAIQDGTILSAPSQLASFTIISFYDLKKHNFIYQFAFPVFQVKSAWQLSATPIHLDGNDTSALVDVMNTHQYGIGDRERGFFLARRVRGWSSASNSSGSDGSMSRSEHDDSNNGPDLGYKWEVAPLRRFDEGTFFGGVADEDMFVGFVDPSTHESAPSWFLRNLLVVISERFRLKKVNILCYRDIHAQRHLARSFILPLRLGPTYEALPNDQIPKIIGWEKNAMNKNFPKTAALSAAMDPHSLADASVDLNLKLMKWRIAPQLNLSVIKRSKCLLLGAGTLGTYVSRNLMGWGVRHITFVDYGNVSFSNPVRQPLFNFNDCLDGGIKKAFRAAEALREIYPGVKSEGHVFEVPMLGHPILNENITRQQYDLLKELFQEHDVIFLLMDSRESRWLPTLMGKAMGKIVINAALGFDTYLVMRHGVSPPGGAPAKLGCYFCNDVVAPADSMKDQTLDQQCTVTRPGIAAIASAYAVELLVSILQHPDKALALAPVVDSRAGSRNGGFAYERSPADHPLGLIPHQLRGFLADFRNMLISGQSYDSCSACSEKVVNAYKEGEWEFLKRALTETGYVEELSGLAEVHRRAEAAAATLELEESDEEEYDWGEDVQEDDSETVPRSPSSTA